MNDSQNIISWLSMHEWKFVVILGKSIIHFDQSQSFNRHGINPMMPTHDMDTFRIIVPLWGESNGHIGPVMQSFDVFFISAWTSCWTNYQVASDLRCHDASVMASTETLISFKVPDEMWKY